MKKFTSLILLFLISSLSNKTAAMASPDFFDCVQEEKKKIRELKAYSPIGGHLEDWYPEREDHMTIIELLSLFFMCDPVEECQKVCLHCCRPATRLYWRLLYGCKMGPCKRKKLIDKYA